MIEEISIFADEGQSEEARSIAFSNLDMMLVDIDQATNVGRMKQWNILIPLLASPSIDIRCQTLHILAICAQNNPEVQNSLATLDVLEKSFNLLTDKDQPLKVRQKSMLLISSLVQHNHANFNLFRTKLDGFTALDTILDDEVCGENLQARIIFFVKSIMNSSEQIEDPEEDRTKDLNFDPSPYPAIMRRISDRTNDN